MIHGPRRGPQLISHLPSSFPPFLHSNNTKQWLSTTLSLSPRGPSDPPIEFSIISSLKSISLSSGQQLHSFAIKSGLEHSNLFVRNSLVNFYGKCGKINDAEQLFCSSPAIDTASCNIMIALYFKLRNLGDAHKVFDEMPEKDCVSFTTMIMGFAQNGLSIDAMAVFREMLVAGVMPNEVTLASVISACSHLGAIALGKMIHGLGIKFGLEQFVLVSTNLVHFYAVCSKLEDSKKAFDLMQEKNVVTWNAMLNGYAKAGLIDSAKDLFSRIPAKDLVSWSTMIDGFLRVDRLEEALYKYGLMLQDVDARPNEVMLVNLVSASARFSAIREGQQLHAVILKTGLDSHAFVQATIIHFYASCEQIELACLQFSLGCESNISSWNALIAGFIKNGMVDEARLAFCKMPERDVVSWSTMIAGFVQYGKSDLALEFFREMQQTGIQANEITLASLLSAIASSGTIEEGKWVDDYITENSIPLSDNLSAGLIDMYAKHGSIKNAMRVFNHVRDDFRSVSPWNAIICGLAMHGHAEMSLDIFSDMLGTRIQPNSVTFIGVLSACCHAGLVTVGRRHFESMKSEYGIEPKLKHYGCMVDLLGRAGCLEEAERLIDSMPLDADVVIWGSLLAASRTHGNVEVGERAAKNLAKLDPGHGAGRVLLSNIYADAGRWDDVVSVRRAMQDWRMKRSPGFSGILR